MGKQSSEAAFHMLVAPPTGRSMRDGKRPSSRAKYHYLNENRASNGLDPSTRLHFHKRNQGWTSRKQGLGLLSLIIISHAIMVSIAVKCISFKLC